MATNSLHEMIYLVPDRVAARISGRLVIDVRTGDRGNLR